MRDVSSVRAMQSASRTISIATAALSCLLGSGLAWAGAEADGTAAGSTADLAAGTSIQLSSALDFSMAPLASTRVASVVLPAALFAADPLEANPPPPFNSKEDEWWLEPSLSLWLPGIQGTLGARGLTVSGSASVSEILGDADSLIGIMGSVDFGRGRLGGYIWGSYMELGFEAGPLERISIKNSVALLGFGLSYELGRWPMAYTATADKPARDLALQARVGGRYSGVGVDLSPANLGTVSLNEGWVDPMIGVRMSLPLSQKLSFVISGELGGFGAASDLAWGAGGLFSWDFTIGKHPSSLQLGYMAVGDDYTTGSGSDKFVWDTILKGPLINFRMRF